MILRGTLLGIAGALAIAAAPLGSEEAAPAGKAARSIAIQPKKDRFPLGGAMPVRVIYSNPAGSAWKLTRPETSEAVQVSYHPAGKSDRKRLTFPLGGKTFQEVRLPDGSTRRSEIVPKRVEVEIQPGEKREFDIDIHTGWTEELAPGKYEMELEDAGQGMKSNRASWTLVFSKESIPLLLGIAANEAEIPARRLWSARWLKKLKPDFEIKLPGKEETPGAAGKIAAGNAAAIRAYREFWEKAAGTREVDILLQKADPEAGGGSGGQK